MVTRVRYISDNPFRLLSTGSACRQRELRTKAAAIELAAKVGLALEPGLVDVFGSDDLCNCVNIVTALSNDPISRTMYRLFWPFSILADGCNCPTLEEFEQMLDQSTEQISFHQAQLSFLDNWYHFTIGAEWVRLEAALSHFRNLYEDTECDEYLQSLLEEEGIGPDQTKALNYQAQNQTVHILLQRGCMAAMDAWERQEYRYSVELLRTVVDCGFAEDIVDKALVEIVPACDRQMASIQTEIDAFQSWTPDIQEALPAELEPFHQLAILVRDRLPSTPLWIENLEEHIRSVAYSMRGYAIDLANDKSDYKLSLAILTKMQGASWPEDLQQQVDEDILIVTRLATEHESWAQIKPVDAVPSLSTVNGIGSKLYGRNRFELRPEWYFATLYFVVLDIPIIPVERYLVSDAPGGGWYFHGRTSLSKSGAIHRWISILSIITILLWGVVSVERNNSSGASGASGVDAPAASPFVPGPTAAANEESVESKLQAKQERVARLKTEHDTLKAEMDAEDTALDRMKHKLQATKADIIAERDEASANDSGSMASLRKHAQQYEKDIENYNTRVNAYNAKVHRMKQVVQALNESGE